MSRPSFIAAFYEGVYGGMSMNLPAAGNAGYILSPPFEGMKGRVTEHPAHPLPRPPPSRGRVTGKTSGKTTGHDQYRLFMKGDGR
jgi:hypothetical protein